MGPLKAQLEPTKKLIHVKNNMLFGRYEANPFLLFGAQGHLIYAKNLAVAKLPQ